MGTLTSKLIIQLLDRVSAPSKAIAKRMQGLQASVGRNNARMAAMRDRMVVAGAAAYGLGKAVSAPIKAAMDFESAMADVKKVVDFDTPDGLKRMAADIIELSKRIPIAATGLAEITAAAGQSGMKGGELLSFTEVVAKLATAFDMTAKDAGTAMTKLKTAFGLTVADTSSFADALNHLSNNMAATAPNLIDFLKSVTAEGERFGFNATQTAAFGAAMISAGAQADVAATSFRNIGRALTQGDDVTEKTAAAFKKLGLTSMQVTKAMQKDAVGVFNSVIKRISKVPAHLRPSLISEIFGDEARAIAPLISNTDLLKNALALVAKETNYLGSAQKEFEARSDTAANAVQLFKNRVHATSIALGDSFLPSLKDVMKALEPLTDRLEQFAKNNPVLTRTIAGVTGGLVALSIAATATSFALAFLKGGLILAAITSLRALGFAARATAFMFLPLTGALRAARTAMIGFAATTAILGTGGALKMAGTALLGLLNPIRLVRGAMVALKWAVIGTGIGAILLAIGAAGKFIADNWTGIQELFSGIGEGIMSALQPVMPIVQPVVDAFKTLFGLFDDGSTKLDKSNASWRATGKSIGEGIGNVITWVIEKVMKLFNLLAEIPGKLRGLFSSVPSAPGGAKSSFIGNSISGARASGGPVRKGSTYLVGENGPELFTSHAAGLIHNTNRTVAALKANAIAASGVGTGAGGGGGAGRGAGSITNVNVGGITVHGAAGQSAKEIAGEVERIFSAKLSATSRGSFSDGVYA